MTYLIDHKVDRMKKDAFTNHYLWRKKKQVHQEDHIEAERDFHLRIHSYQEYANSHASLNQNSV